MKSFKEVLNEGVQWQRSLFDHLFMNTDELLADEDRGDVKPDYIFQDANDRTFQLVLDAKHIERLVTPAKLIAAHSTGFRGLQKLIQIQNKRTKQISAYTVDNFASMLSGLWADGAGEIIVILEGTALVGDTKDIMTKPDKKGTRVVNIGENAELNYHTILKGSEPLFVKNQKIVKYKELLSKLVKFKQSLLEKLRKEYADKRIGEDKEDTTSPYDVPGKVKHNYIKQYIAGTENIIKSNKEYHELFNEILMRWPSKQSMKWSKEDVHQIDYDEIVLSNFKILKVYFTKDALGTRTVADFKNIIKGIPSQQITQETHDLKPNVVQSYIKQLGKELK